jgi:hypothetical protein
MIYYKTTISTYNDFIKENGTNRLSKNEKLEVPGCGVNKFLSIKKIDEIFDSKIDKLEYKEEEYKHPKYSNEKNITYFFKSKSNTEYRLDLVILIEEDSNLKDKRLHNKKFISVSFSLANSSSDNYDDVTNLDELYDVMSRIRYLIELNEYKTKHNYIFMFGKPSDDKIKMYEYFIKICFPDYKLILDYTSGFPNTNIGYYLNKE